MGKKHYNKWTGRYDIDEDDEAADAADDDRATAQVDREVASGKVARTEDAWWDRYFELRREYDEAANPGSAAEEIEEYRAALCDEAPPSGGQRPAKRRDGQGAPALTGPGRKADAWGS